jgi:hypothetical protein
MAEWNWIQVLCAIVAHWVIVVGAYILRNRLRVRYEEPDFVHQVSENEMVVAYSMSLNPLPAALVLLGPPLILVLAIVLSG